MSTLYTILNQRTTPEIPYYIYSAMDKRGGFFSGSGPAEKIYKSYGGRPHPVTAAWIKKPVVKVIENAFKDVSDAIGLKFKRVDDPQNSLFDVAHLADYVRVDYYIENKKPRSILGQSMAYSNNEKSGIWKLLTFTDTPDGTIGKKNADLDTIATIKHEIGHAFGLSHPGEKQDGFNPKFNLFDTLMSYNITDPVNSNYTKADKSALNIVASDIQKLPDGAIPSPITIDKSDPVTFDEETQKNAAKISDIKKLHISKQSFNQNSSDKKLDSKHDFLTGMIGDDQISSGHGWDIVKTGRGSDYIHSGRGNDFIKSGNDHDIVRGGSGSDFIHGGRGDDKLFGGAGIDIIKAGPGQDTIVINRKHLHSGYDSLVGFTDDDMIKLIGFDDHERLYIKDLANKSLLQYGCRIIAAIDTTITFDDHVIVV
jgi:hypothetical protein